jgi:hypothetical protein
VCWWEGKLKRERKKESKKGGKIRKVEKIKNKVGKKEDGR